MRDTMTQSHIQQWKPINYLSTFQEIVFSMLESTLDQYHSLLEVKRNPHIFDDDEVEEIVRTYKEQIDNTWLFENQLSHWQDLNLPSRDHQRVQELLDKTYELRQATEKILYLAEVQNLIFDESYEEKLISE